jgi:hypothetical protein
MEFSTMTPPPNGGFLVDTQREAAGQSTQGGGNFARRRKGIDPRQWRVPYYLLTLPSAQLPGKVLSGQKYMLTKGFIYLDKLLD